MQRQLRDDLIRVMLKHRKPMTARQVYDAWSNTVPWWKLEGLLSSRRMTTKYMLDMMEGVGLVERVSKVDHEGHRYRLTDRVLQLPKLQERETSVPKCRVCRKRQPIEDTVFCSLQCAMKWALRGTPFWLWCPVRRCWEPTRKRQCPKCHTQLYHELVSYPHEQHGAWQREETELQA